LLRNVPPDLFAGGAIVTLLANFDVWGSELPGLEIHGTK